MKHSSILAVALLVTGSQACMAASCMVVGEKTARVHSAEGEKSPVFLTQSCESLRLLAGKAMVTWVARDGKPYFAPIGANGPDKLPVAAAEERASTVVWGELTSKRETRRIAAMRTLPGTTPDRIYIPAEGLVVPAKAGAILRVLRGEAGDPVFEAPSGQPIRLGRDLMKAGESYTLEWNLAGTSEKWHWQMLGAQDLENIDRKHEEVTATLADDAQRRLVAAMMFEQLGLKVNMVFALAAGL